MKVQLNSFLEERRVDRGQFCTHTTKSTGDLEGGWPSGSYLIQSDDKKLHEDFWTLYCNAVNRKEVLTLTEKPGPFNPLRVDFDFKASHDLGPKRQYTLTHLKKVVTIYKEEIEKIIDYQIFDEKMVWCIVLEKKAPRKEEGYIKDGFHIHFPFFISKAWVQDDFLRTRVTTRMIEEGVWNDTNYITPVAEMIDERMSQKPWMMYGSMNYKGPTSTPYLYNRWDRVDSAERYGHAFDYNVEEISLDEMFKEEMRGRKNSLKYYLPRFLTTRNFTKQTILSKDVKEPTIRRKRYVKKVRSDEDVMKDLKTIESGNIMKMLSDDRADSRQSWMDVGWTLFSIGQGEEKALQMWIDFSRRSNKFVEGVCEREWLKMEVRNKTIASLFAMARNDNEEEYNEWKKTNIRYWLFNSLNEEKPTEGDISRVVVKMYDDRFKCVDSKKDIWYEFRDHRWHEMDESLEIRKKVTDEVGKYYADLKLELNNELANTTHSVDIGHVSEEEKFDLEREQKQKKLKWKRCSAIVTALKTIKFIEKVVKMSKMYLHDSKFTKLMDENKMLVGCENGVIDLELGVFRDGRPDDYITKSTGQHYKPRNWDDEEIRELKQILVKFYPNPNRRKYFVSSLASCLQGGNIHKRFYVFTGESDGGKSAIFKLIDLTFGSGVLGYTGKFPRALLIQKTGASSSSSARPDLARVRGRRIMSVQEITPDDGQLNIGFIKEATGNDSFYSRGLYEKGTEINPMFVLMMQCNDPPAIPGHDEATWSRVRVVDHESKFVKPQDLHKWPVPKSHAQQLKKRRFKADPNFGMRLPELAAPFLWMLFQTYLMDKEKGGYEEPNEVLMATNNYQKDNDVYQQFIEARIEKVSEEEAPNTFIKSKEIRTEFKDWHLENYPSFNNKMTKTKIEKELSRHLGKIREDEDLYGFGKMSRFYGYRFKEDENEGGVFQ